MNQKEAIEMQVKSDGQEVIDELDFADSLLEAYE